MYKRQLVSYRGGTPPHILQPNPTTPEAFRFRDQLSVEIQQTVEGQLANPGEVLPRLDSASGVTLIMEQNNQRFNSNIAKRSKYLRDLAALTLSVAGQYYDVDDGRVFRRIGKDKQHDVKFFDITNFNRPYDVQFKDASGLPEQRSAKIATIIDLLQAKGDLLTKEEILDMLDMDNSEKYLSLIHI